MDIKSRFCIRCGKQQKELIDSLCPKCYIELNKPKLPNKIILQICPKCKAVNYKGFWVKTDVPLTSLFKQLIFEKIKTPEQVKPIEITSLELGKPARVCIKFKIKRKILEKCYNIANIEIKKVTCPSCAAKSGRAWKAKVQLRGLPDTALMMLKNFQSIIEVKEVKNGFDILFANTEESKKYISLLKQKFKLLIKTSTKQYGWNKAKSKPKYKVIFSVRKQ